MNNSDLIEFAIVRSTIVIVELLKELMGGVVSGDLDLKLNLVLDNVDIEDGWIHKLFCAFITKFQVI